MRLPSFARTLVLCLWLASLANAAERSAPTAAAAVQFVVILQSSSDPLEQLKASIPAQFQDNEVFTARRTSEGKTLYDICLGHFPTLIDAERAQKVLLKRFANASVIPFRANTAPPPATAPAKVR